MRGGAAALLWVGVASSGCGGPVAAPAPRAVVAVDAMAADVMVADAMVADASDADASDADDMSSNATVVDAMPGDASGADVLTAGAAVAEPTVGAGSVRSDIASDAVAAPSRDVMRAPPVSSPERPASLELQVRAVSGATAEPLLRPVVFELRETLAQCRGASAARRVVVEATIEPFGGRARAWMTWPDKRNLTVEQWAAVQPVGRCVADAIGERRWPRPGDGMPATFEVELRWR